VARAPEEEALAGALASSGIGTAKLAPTRQKMLAHDANYTEDAPAPFNCGNCKWIVWGGDREKTSDDYCQLVEGPYPDGHIDPGDGCRFWTPKPDAAQESSPSSGEALGELPTDTTDTEEPKKVRDARPNAPR
jgi:hypothetical protein